MWQNDPKTESDIFLTGPGRLGIHEDTTRGLKKKLRSRAVFRSLLTKQLMSEVVDVCSGALS